MNKRTIFLSMKRAGGGGGGGGRDFPPKCMVLVACKINTQLKVPILSLQSAILRFRGGDTGGEEGRAVCFSEEKGNFLEIYV